jgi:3-hydroxyisobutyrate dehydrogenase-like beta-hydroxyacid dehydrogenase
MAARLLARGHEVVVWNRTPERAEPLLAQGARAADTPAEAAAAGDATITMLSDPDALEQVVFGHGGLASTLPGRTLIEMSTVGPDMVRRLAAALPPEAGILDAPVLGSIPQAAEGTLRIFVGGDADRYERFRPVLDDLGRPRHLGPLGAGAAMKLVTNLCLGVLMTGLAEALALADALELDEAAALDVLSESPIGVTTRSKRELIESGSYPPRFRLALAAKDMRLVVETAERAEIPLEVALAARDRLLAAEDHDLGDLDYSAVVAHVRRRPARP